MQEALYQRAMSKKGQSNYAGALLDLTEAIRLDPRNAQYYCERASCRAAAGDGAGAVADLTQAIGLKPQPLFYYMRALHRGFLRDVDGAIADFTEAIRLSPASAQYYSGRADLHKRKGNYSAAIADYSTSLRLDSSQLSIHHNLGLCEFALGNYPAAIAKFTKAIELGAGGDNHYQRALCYVKQGKYVEAISDCSKASEREVFSELALQLRAECYQKIGKKLEADADLTRVRDILRGTAAQGLYFSISQGQRVEALNQLRKLRELFPDNPPMVRDNNAQQEPALFTIIRAGHVDWLEDFLPYFRIDVTDAHGNTALHIAANQGDRACCDTLIKRGAITSIGEIGGYRWPVNNAGETPLSMAAASGQTALLLYFKDTYLAERNLQAISANGDTLLHIMVRHNQVAALRALLQSMQQNKHYFLSVRAQNNEGLDPLMLAAGQGRVEMVRMLIEQPQLDLVNRDKRGRTALHLAVLAKNKDVVQCLVEKGALIQSIDHEGNFPIGYATADSEIGVYLNGVVHEKTFIRQHFTQEFPHWENLVFEGGGVKGAAYPGAYAALLDPLVGKCDLAQFKRVGGTSAGAIFALIVGLGFSPEEIAHILGTTRLAGSTLPQIRFAELLDGEWGQKLLAAKNHDVAGLIGASDATAIERLRQIDTMLSGLARLFDGSLFGAVRGVKRLAVTAATATSKLNMDLGLCPGDRLYDLFEQLIQIKLAEKASSLRSATFAELAALGFKHMYFVGVNLQTAEAEYFSHEHTPDMLVANAVRISMSIPGVFVPQPKKMKDAEGRIVESVARYVDGGLLRNFAIKLFDFARYDRDCPSAQANVPRINRATLGIRLVLPQVKTRYEGTSGGGAQLSTVSQASGLLNHIKDLLYAVYNREESDHVLDGESFRTVYVNIGNVGTLDFDELEKPSVIEFLTRQGKEAVRDFLRRIPQDRSHRVELPERLEKAIKAQAQLVKHSVDHGSRSMVIKLNPNCPELLVAFYEFNDVRILDYLHNELGLQFWTRDEEGNTAFHIAARSGNRRALQNLLAVRPEGAKAINDQGQTPEELLPSAEHELAKLLQKSKEVSVASAPAVSKPPRPPSLTQALPQGVESIDVPADNDCLFWSAMLGLLLPLCHQDQDKEEFYRLFTRLFGHVTEFSTKEEQDGIRQILVDWAAAGFSRGALELLGNGCLRLLVNRLRERVVGSLDDVIASADLRAAIVADSNVASWEIYKERMAHPKEYWGGDAEINAIASLANVRIAVYGANYARNIPEQGREEPRLVLHHVNQNHYHFGYKKPAPKLRESKDNPVALGGQSQSAEVVPPTSRPISASGQAALFSAASRDKFLAQQLFKDIDARLESLSVYDAIIWATYLPKVQIHRSLDTIDQAKLGALRKIRDDLDEVLATYTWQLEAS